MTIGTGYRPKPKPRVSKAGEVHEYDSSEHNLTLDYLMHHSRGFLKPYWPIVRRAKQWVYSELPKRNGMAANFSSARTNGKDSPEYISASALLHSLTVEYINSYEPSLPLGINRQVIEQLLINEVLGMGIIDPIWADKRVHEIYVNGPYDIQVEMDDGLHRIDGASFESQAHAMEFCISLLGDYNKTLDSIQCVAESRLHDGSRFEALHTSICPAGPNIDIRRHDPRHWTISDLVHTGMTNREMLIDLERYIRLGMSALVIGGTSTGKTTVLNALSGLFPDGQRIVTIEDTLELNLNPNKFIAAPIEARSKGLNGKGEVTLRTLVKTSLRLSPAVIVIGETRGAEAYDMVEAANTGHQVFSTLHANNATDAISRTEMAISQGGELMGTETLGAIQSAFAIIVEIRRFIHFGGRTQRIITGIHEVDTKISKNAAGEPVLGTHPLWKFVQKGVDKNRNVIGDWVKVNDISSERQAMLSDYAFQKPLTWEQMLQLENVAVADRMFKDDRPMYPTAEELDRRRATRPPQQGDPRHAAPQQPTMAPPVPVRTRPQMPPRP